MTSPRNVSRANYAQRDRPTAKSARGLARDSFDDPTLFIFQPKFNSLLVNRSPRTALIPRLRQVADAGLNRAVAIATRHGPAVGLALIEAIFPEAI